MGCARITLSRTTLFSLCAAVLLSLTGCGETKQQRLLSVLFGVSRDQDAKELTYASGQNDDATKTYGAAQVTKLLGNLGSVKIGKITFHGADLTSSGGMTADAIVFEDVKLVFPAGHIEIDKIDLDGLVLGAPSATPRSNPSLDQIPVFKSLLSEGVRGQQVGGEPFDYKSIQLETGAYDGGILTHLHIAAKMNPSDVLEAVGYDKAEMVMEISLSWDPAAKTLELANTSIDVPGAGKLAIKGKFGEIDRYLMTSPQLLQQFPLRATLLSASARFEDHSLTNRFLTLVSAQHNIDLDTGRGRLADYLPTVLADAGDGIGQDKLRKVFRTFFSDPKSLSVSSDITEPIPLMQLITTGIAAPSDVVSRLKLDIEANQ